MDTLTLALALVCQFSSVQCQAANTVHITEVAAYPYAGISPFGWYDYRQRTVFYIPRALGGIRIQGQDRQLAVGLSHELTHVVDMDNGITYNYQTCWGMESRAYTQENRLFQWLIQGGLTFLPTVPQYDAWADLTARMECRMLFGV